MTRVPQRFKVPPLCLIAHLTATALAGPRGQFDPPFQRAAWAAVIERMACLSMPDERPEVQVHATSAFPRESPMPYSPILHSWSSGSWPRCLDDPKRMQSSVKS